MMSEGFRFRKPTKVLLHQKMSRTSRKEHAVRTASHHGPSAFKSRSSSSSSDPSVVAMPVVKRLAFGGERPAEPRAPERKNSSRRRKSSDFKHVIIQKKALSQWKLISGSSKTNITSCLELAINSTLAKVRKSHPQSFDEIQDFLNAIHQSLMESINHLKVPTSKQDCIQYNRTVTVVNLEKLEKIRDQKTLLETAIAEEKRLCKEIKLHLQTYQMIPEAES